MARGRERGVTNAGDWQQQQRAKTLLLSASQLPDLEFRPLALWSQALPALDALKEALTASGGDVVGAWGSAGDAVVHQLRRCETLDAHLRWNSAVLQWLLFLAWEDVRRCYPAGFLDEFAPVLQYMLPTGFYARIVVAMGWETLVGDALLWLPNPADSAPLLLASLFEIAPCLAAPILATLLRPGAYPTSPATAPKLATPGGMAAVLIAGLEAGFREVLQEKDKVAALNTLARYVVWTLRERHTLRCPKAGLDEGEGLGSCREASVQLLLDLLMQWGSCLEGADGGGLRAAHNDLRQALEDLLAEAVEQASTLLRSRTEAGLWGCEDDEATFRACCHIRTRLSLLNIQQPAVVASHQSQAAKPCDLEAPPGNRSPSSAPRNGLPHHPPRGGSANMAGEPHPPLFSPPAPSSQLPRDGEQNLPAGQGLIWQRMLRLANHPPPAALRGSRGAPGGNVPIERTRAVGDGPPRLGLGLGLGVGFSPPPSIAATLQGRADAADTWRALPNQAVGDRSLPMRALPDEAGSSRSVFEAAAEGLSVDEGISAQLLARGVAGFPRACFGNPGEDFERVPVCVLGGRTLEESLDAQPYSPFSMAISLLHMLKHMACSDCAGLLASGTWEGSIRVAANTASLVTDAGERRTLLSFALVEPDLAPLRAALDADVALQTEASSAVVAACNRMASGDEEEIRVFGDGFARVGVAVGEILGPALLAPTTTLYRLVSTACRNPGQASFLADVLREMPDLMSYVEPQSGGPALCLALSSAITEAAARPRPTVAAGTLAGFVDHLLSWRADRMRPAGITLEQLLAHVIVPQLQTLAVDPSPDTNVLVITLRLLELLEHRPTSQPDYRMSPAHGSHMASMCLPQAGALLGPLITLADRHYRATEPPPPTGATPTPGPARMRGDAAVPALTACAGVGDARDGRDSGDRRDARDGEDDNDGGVARNGGDACDGGDGNDGGVARNDGDACDGGDGSEGGVAGDGGVSAFRLPSSVAAPLFNAVDSVVTLTAAAADADSRRGIADVLARVPAITWRARLLMLPILDPETSMTALMPPSLRRRGIVEGFPSPSYHPPAGPTPSLRRGGVEELTRVQAHHPPPAPKSDAGSGGSVLTPGHVARPGVRRAHGRVSPVPNQDIARDPTCDMSHGPTCPEALLGDILHFCCGRASHAEAFASAVRAGGVAGEGATRREEVVGGGVSLDTRLAEILAAAVWNCGRGDIRRGLVVACARLLPHYTPDEFNRVVKVAIPALLPLASGTKPEGLQRVCKDPEADMDTTTLALTMELLCRACYLVALSPEIVALLEEEGAPASNGVSDARQNAVDALLQHMASICARATADVSQGAAGNKTGRKLARRFLLETCELVALLQPTYSCAGIEFLLMHLVKAALDSSEGSDKRGPGDVSDVVDTNVDANNRQPAADQVKQHGATLVGWVSKQVGKLQSPLKDRLVSAITKIAAS